MESEETSEGATTPPRASSITGEAWDSSAVEGEHHATHTAAKMSTSSSNSAKGPELSTPKDCLAAPGKAAEMLGRPSNSMQKVPAGLEQAQGDTEPQKGLSELEGEMLLEEGGLDYSLKLRQLELVDLETNQDPSSHSRFQDEPAPGSPILQAVKLSTEFPQCQAELAFHGSDPQAQETKSPLADAISSQRETPKCFLVCKTVSEGHYKAEPFLDNICKDSLQEVDAGAEQEQSTKKLAPAPDEQPTSEGAVEPYTKAKPYTSKDVQESLRAPQGLEKNTESSSFHQLSSSLTCDSKMSSLQAEGNNSPGETGNTSMVKDQGMVPKETSSASKCLHLEDDSRKTEGRPSAESAFQGKSASKRTEEVAWHKEPAWEEAVSELQQEEEEEECKEQNLPEEGKPLELKDQKSKEQNEREQLQREELRLGEELKLEVLSSAFGSEIPSVSRHNVDVCGLENASLSEQTGSVFPPGELVSVDQHPGEDVLLKAHVTEAGSGCQSPAVGPLSSNNHNPGRETPHMCHVSDQAEDLEDSGRFSIGGQDIGETHWDDKTRLSRENEHSDGHGKAVQRFDKSDASLCGGVTAPFSAENPESLVPAHPSSGTSNLEPPDPIDLNPITGKAELWDFIPASPSEITSVVSASVPEQEGARIPSVTPEHCPGTSLNELPDSAGKPPNQAAPAQGWDPTPAETAVVRTGAREAKASHELLTSEEGFNEDLSDPSSFSVMYTSSLPLQGNFPGDRTSVASIAGPLEVSQTPGRTSTPLSHPETIHQISPQKSAIIHGKEMAADMDHKAQVPLFDKPDCSLYQKEPGSRISSVLSTLTWPSEDDTVLAVNQQGQPLSPVSHSSLPLVSEPDAKQLPHPPSHVQRPSQAQAPALHANHLVPPPAPEGDQLLAPEPHSRPPLRCGMDDGKLGAIHPAPSRPLRTATSAIDANSVASASDGESLAERDDLVPVSGEWDLGDSGPHDTETSDDSGVSLLTKSFLALGNEMLVGCSDTSPETADHHMDIESGKSSPDHPSWPSLEGLITSPDSKSRDSALPMLAFTNPIHFLRLSPPLPLTTRTTCRDKELRWEQPAGSFGGDTKSIQAPLAVTEKTEGERRVRQRLEGGEHQPKEEKAKHAPLEKSSSWPDKKTVGVAVQDPAANQENPIKSRVKTKDWHRQGLKRMSVPPDILQQVSSVPSEEEAHKAHREPPVSSETVIMREKKSADTTENFKRRHSKLINSSRVLYQEYSDVALNKAIQSQKRVDYPEDIESSFPSSPRLRRKVLSPQDSYLQRLSVSSNASLWQDIPMVRGSRMLLNMSREEQRLQEAKFELIISEASYLRSLNVAVDHFQRSAELQAMLTNQERQWLFSRLSDVRDVSASFLFDLEEKFEEDMFTFHVCDVALKHAPDFRRVYLPYVTNQTYQDQTFQRLLNGNAGFQQVLERLESDPVCQRLSLKSFLILPFQRITRLKLLLQNILKRTRPGSEEEVQATQAYDALEKLIKDCNENVQRMKSTEELIYLSQKIEFECKIFPLISQSRRLVKCGELTALDFNNLSPKWKVTTRPIYLHLFNDCLLLSRPKEGGRFVVFDHAAFSYVRGEKCEMKLHGANKNLFRLFLLQNNQGKRVEFLFRTETHSEKLRWISALAPPRGEPDLLECPDAPQVQCIKTYKARENDELALEKADIIMVMQYSNDGWIEGVKLSDRERGWFPSEHVENISSKHVRQKNLKEEQRVKNAKQQVFCKK
ncbi:rho guanine nucleotide exchange factor 5 [Passer montanus]|uniref:rho guanine nucleotide exchange factor 5 n=1 Tax=Passer montanus TaxID=9160 RepID=UPI001960D9E2|nr:rho guanine nucleotide exchange factor 5 [Passer montanus]XP_039575977.1 rho guanine nucleotide exchange factor 5 [Passer montanus]XP_039575987.1 rho guanine nucleotide exchange factor 5 [Passer montanus]XP_039575997.1 rho guanine nucleotide exchange factor 5 [Passer montanus]XP_039576006.1 rho guanine nucleotide exchange factor 5 [Passer montanus]XP_039576015.1 rho guanine nucleotide exchange factor 5 [Passer montanus]XP_039576024.1 rho guanine nucleotide exchange factor 5 [Passer montanu